MSLKKSIVINDKKNICQDCKHSNTCKYYTKYQKMLDLFENIDPDEYLIKLVCHIKKCNQYLSDKEE